MNTKQKEDTRWIQENSYQRL